MVVRELVARLGLKVDEKSFSAGDVAVAGIQKGLLALGGGLVAAAAGVGALVRSAIDTGSRWNDLSAQTGETTDNLQSLGYAAEQSGVSVEAMVSSLGILQREMYEASQGNKEALKAFEELGIEVTGADGKLKDANTVMLEMAKAFPKLQDGNARTAIAMKLLGRGGRPMLAMMKEGEEGIAALQERFKSLGGGMSGGLIKDLDKAGDTMGDVKVVLASIGNTITEAVLPAFQEFLDATLEWFRANKDIIRLRLSQVLKGVGIAFKVLGGAARGVVSLFKYWKPILIAVTAALTVFAGVMLGKAALALGLTLAELPLVAAAYLFMGWAAVKAALASAAAWLVAIAPLALAALGVAFLIGLVEDLYQAFTGGQSLLADFWHALWDTETGEAIKQFFGWFADKWAELGGLGGLWNTAIAEWKGVFLGFWEWLKGGFLSALSAIPGGSFLMSQLAGSPTAQGLATGTAGAFGGGASPAASVAASSTSSVTSTARVSAPITINAAPGQDANAIGAAVRAHVRDELRTTFREADVAVQQ